MKKKTRPNAPARALGPQPADAPPPPPPQPVMHGSCFATFMQEAMSMNNEVIARREYDKDVGEYLVSKGLAADFNVWRDSKRQQK